MAKIYCPADLYELIKKSSFIDVTDNQIMKTQVTLKPHSFVLIFIAIGLMILAMAPATRAGLAIPYTADSGDALTYGIEIPRIIGRPRFAVQQRANNADDSGCHAGQN